MRLARFFASVVRFLRRCLGRRPLADRSKNLVFDPNFLWCPGAFWGSWNSVELIISLAIGKLLNISYERTHILTSGMEFGRTANLLRNLVYQLESPDKGKITKLIGRLLNESKRNALAHGILVSNPTTVTFIDRTRGGDYSATAHRFTLREFSEHIQNITKIGEELRVLLSISNDDLHDFAMAALRADTKSTKSPVPPNSKA